MGSGTKTPDEGVSLLAMGDRDEAIQPLHDRTRLSAAA